MLQSIRPLLGRIKKHDKTALAQAITFAESDFSSHKEIFSLSIPSSIRRIGITGPPGVGKSTLISHYTKYLLKKKRSVGILSIDPSSAISGGALLGDRVRMQEISGNKKVFIRSLSSKGALGGLSPATSAVLRLYELWGFDDILIETVGSGQSDIEISMLAETTVLVMIPQLGDEIQALKAGIMEMVHVIALNRAEQMQAKETISSLLASFSAASDKKHQPPIVELKNLFAEGLEKLDAAITVHKKSVNSQFSAFKSHRIHQEALNLAFHDCTMILQNNALKTSKGTSVLALKENLLKSLKRSL